MTTSLPEVDGRSLWEVVVRMDTKLDVALQRLDDHEDRLRGAAPQASVDALAVEIARLTLEQASLANRPVVTPKGLVAAMVSTITILLGVLALIDKLPK